MKRLRRIAWYALVMLSALLWVATYVVWTRGGWSDNSGRFHDFPFLSRTAFILDGSAHPGAVDVVQLVVVRSSNNMIVGPNWGKDGRSTPALDAWLKRHRDVVEINHFGFRLTVGPEIGGVKGGPAVADGTRLFIMMPYWQIATLFSILPVIAALLWLRAHSQTSKPLLACRKCGYDLRATRDRCPECGTAV